VNGKTVGAIGPGLMVLLGVGEDDSADAVEYVADKIATLRIFADASGKMNLAIHEISGAVLAVSQFTLFGDVRKGRRPSFIKAARPELAVPLYELFVEKLRARGLRVECGVFGADMEVELINDGPVTILIDSEGVL
jgi:D-tyrosyl-tRNA(Tyr) deacylase